MERDKLARKLGTLANSMEGLANILISRDLNREEKESLQQMLDRTEELITTMKQA